MIISTVMIVIGLTICMIALLQLSGIDLQDLWAKRIKPSPLKLPQKSIVSTFETVKDVFDSELEVPPTGCLWEIEKIKSVHMNNEMYGRIKLVTPDGIYRLHQDVEVPKSNMEFELLAKKVGTASRRIINSYVAEHGDWDGIYSKDVL